MIVPSGKMRVLVATKPIDFRNGMEGALVSKTMGSDPTCEGLYGLSALNA